jgi:hypothetical protein
VKWLSGWDESEERIMIIYFKEKLSEFNRTRHDKNGICMAFIYILKHVLTSLLTDSHLQIFNHSKSFYGTEIQASIIARAFSNSYQSSIIPIFNFSTKKLHFAL